MYVLEPTSDTVWPWGITDTYFINEITPAFVSTTDNLDCLIDVALCSAINFNNLAYGTTSSELTDGNLFISSTYSAGDISWNTLLPQLVNVYVFQLVLAGSITCTSGTCSTVLTTSTYKQWLCNCPLRVITYSATDYQEIQIFVDGDLTRSSVYTY